VFPAVSQRLRRAAYDARWLAVGDAALAVDPISGSGVVRALRTARAAAATVLAMLTGDESRPIAAYEAERDRECTQYLRERAQYYGAERRWDSAPFWRRRICI
jgi:flavin-dependent dehydrogenase